MRRHVVYGLVITLLLAVLTIGSPCSRRGAGEPHPSGAEGGRRRLRQPRVVHRRRAGARPAGRARSRAGDRADRGRFFQRHLHRVYEVGVTAIIDFRL